MKKKGIVLLAVLLFACMVCIGLADDSVKVQFDSVFASLFQKQEEQIVVEGITEDVTYLNTAQTIAADMPGFTMEIDPQRYERIEENGVTYIRAILYLPTEESIRENNSKLLEGLSPEEQETEVRRMLAERLAFYDNLPRCEIEILHLPHLLPTEAAQAARPENASPIQQCQKPEGVYFTYSEGLEPDSLQEDVYFTGDGNSGTFRLTLRYYLEAAEGHGVRMRAMLQTFAIAMS